MGMGIPLARVTDCKLNVPLAWPGALRHVIYNSIASESRCFNNVARTGLEESALPYETEGSTKVAR